MKIIEVVRSFLEKLYQTPSHKFGKKVIAEVEKSLGKPIAFKENGWSESIQCPFHIHSEDSNKPAFTIEKSTGAGICFKNGEHYNLYDLARVIGITPEDYL